jgi:hypothetical protein
VIESIIEGTSAFRDELITPQELEVHLASTFEVLWTQSVPAAQRIEELLKEGPPQI